MLTFENAQFQGTANIVEKLTVRGPYHKMDTTDRMQTLPFGKVQHRVSTKDAQPSHEKGGIVVMVTGALLVPCPSLSQANN